MRTTRYTSIRTLQCVAECGSVLQRVAECCRVLQCVAVCCGDGVISREHARYALHGFTHVAVRCGVLQSVAERCRVLQSVAVCCSVW